MVSARMSPQARLDLLEIWHHIARASLQNAGLVWDDLKDGIRLLSDNPGIGHVRPEVKNPTLRFWSVHSYVIAYRSIGNSIEVVRIVNGRRDFRRLFTGRSGSGDG